MQELKFQRLIAAISFALVAAAILAGGAQADRPDDRAGMLGVGGASSVVVAPDAFERAVNIALQSTPARPDDRGDARGPGVVAPAALPEAVASTSDTIEWSDARLGIASALGAILLMGGIAFGVRRRTRFILP